LRRLIREEAETNMMLRDVDDILDETIMSAAPEIVMAIREREVDEDIDEFIDGALLGGWDANTQSYADPPVVGSDAEVGDKDEVTEMHRLGYDWGWDNPGKVKDENVPDPIRREMVEYALDNFKGRVTEEFVINALETVYDYGKEQMDDVHGILKKIWKKYGWKVAPVFAGVEIFEHAILPAVLAQINPAFMVLATIPTVEILAAAGLAIAKAIGPDKPEPEHVPGHLDWYEEEGKEMRESKMRITKRQLNRIVEQWENDRWNRSGANWDDIPGGEDEDEDVSRDPEVQKMLMDAGFNADGSFGADGYPGPSNWQLYSPKNIEEAKFWINAAIAMNDALRQAETALDRGKYQHAQDAFFEIVYPVQSSFASTGAADTEGREVAGDWLEKQGYGW